MDYLQELDDTVNKLVNILSQNNRTPHKYNTDFLLYSSEIHMIDLIGNHPGLNISELAGMWGASKSAVSRKITRLAEKDLVEKYQLSDNKKEVYIRLTPLGLEAFNGHIEFHRQQDVQYVKNFKSLSERDKRLIIDFLDSYSRCIEEYDYEYE